MAGAITLTEVDFEQIKTNLVDYLKSTRQFTDYDFSGSNLQVILNLIAYQAQLNAYSTNMIANESYLASATVRDNVVSAARTVGYTPSSVKGAQTNITFRFQFTTDNFPNRYPSFIELQPGMVFSTGTGSANFVFNTIDPITAPVSTSGVCVFSDILVREGTYLTSTYTNNISNFSQKFILENKGIDTSTIRVEVQPDPTNDATIFFEQANNIIEVDSSSNVYWIEEVDEERYELTFGDGLFGVTLKDGAKINVTYLASQGSLANGIDAVSNFQYSGTLLTSDGESISTDALISAASTTYGGAEIESVRSIKFNAPRSYSSQNRAVVTEDYESLIRKVYPAIDDIYVYGGEEMDIPQYGRVFVVIKPTTGETLSNSTKNYIVESLNDYRVASLQIAIQDPSILYLEINSDVFYNDKMTLKDASGIASSVKRVLSSYFVEGAIDKFGGAARYSRIVGAIDDSDQAITRNTTTLRMRKDFTIVEATPASYEICFEQALKINTNESVVYSTGFQLEINGQNDGRTYYFEDDTFGYIYLFYFNESGTKVIANQTFGTVDYTIGEVMIGYTTPITFLNTTVINSVIQIRALPFGQDVVAKKSVYLDLDIDNSRIDAVIDTNILSN